MQHNFSLYRGSIDKGLSGLAGHVWTRVFLQNWPPLYLLATPRHKKPSYCSDQTCWWYAESIPDILFEDEEAEGFVGLICHEDEFDLTRAVEEDVTTSPVESAVSLVAPPSSSLVILEALQAPAVPAGQFLILFWFILLPGYLQHTMIFLPSLYVDWDDE